MQTTELGPVLAMLFSELVDGASDPGNAFMLNSGDLGLLRSLDGMTAAAASCSASDGATIAAHTQHVRYGLSLMNHWAREGGNPFANAHWDEAWEIALVDADQWDEIRHGLRDEAHQWRRALGTAREITTVEVSGMIGSIAHLAYHLGALRQIDKGTRGPKEGMFR